MEYYHFLLYVCFGVLPSLVWLFVYLLQDAHPEPKRIILKVFLLGCIVTVPVYFLQVGITQFFDYLQLSPLAHYPALLFDALKWFVAIAFIEEFLKFLVVKFSVFGHKYVDEPVDIMIYMVVAALGFTAVENILYLLTPFSNLSFTAIIEATVWVSFFRFIGATLLHTLCSALLGFFLVLGTRKSRRNIFFLLAGLFLAAGAHGLYDFSITLLLWPFNFLVPATIVFVLIVLVAYSFSKAKQLKSVCKI